MSSTHKALFLLEKYGQFAVREVETYTPGRGELLVEIKAIGLNPLDGKIQDVGIFVQDYPAIIGTDAAGVVKQVGEGVTDFAVGDRVLWEGWLTNSHATFQQYAIISADITAKLPSNLTFEEGSTIPGSYIAAAFGLYSGLTTESGLHGLGLRGAGLAPFWKEGGRSKYAGEPILVMGGSSAIGQIVIQLAKISGFGPIIATASPRNTDLLKSLGATHVVDRNAPLPDAVKSITSLPIRYAYDAISLKETQEAAYEVLAPGGVLILVLGFAVDKSKVDSSKRVVQVFGATADPPQRHLAVELLQILPALLENGELKPNRVEIVPNGLNGIQEALNKLKANKVSATKLVALPWE